MLTHSIVKRLSPSGMLLVLPAVFAPRHALPRSLLCLLEAPEYLAAAMRPGSSKEYSRQGPPGVDSWGVQVPMNPSDCRHAVARL